MWRKLFRWQMGRVYDVYAATTTTKPFLEVISTSIHMGVSENSVPLHPMVNDHYPY